MRDFAGMAFPRMLLAATFALCTGSPRTTCVVDGDTLWLDGAKIRIEDINAPETHSAQCPEELALGEAATRRLIVLLNQGPVTLGGGGGRDRDRYGRLLRTVERRGQSLGAVLVREGLAEPWQGHRRSWC